MKNKKYISTLNMSREDWLAHRRNGTGGSDVAGILGISPYENATPFHVWMDKTARTDGIEEKESMSWGNILEDPIAREYAKRTGQKVERVNRMMWHDNGISFANVDRRIVGTKRLLEVKTAGLRLAHLWGETGSDEVPDWYLLQVQHYLSVTGYEGADIAVLIGGQELRIYHIERDDELIAMIDAAVVEFWEYVKTDTQPTASPSVNAAKLLYGVRQKLDTIQNDNAVDLIDDLKKVQGEIKELQASETALKGELADTIGEHEAVADTGGKILATWKYQASSRFNAKKFKEDHPKLHGEYMNVGESRVMRLKKS